jgi:Protein of unknown function (DUF3048) N-terminal domain/Protein of unknown function (DUF3048) C-terminal domain
MMIRRRGFALLTGALVLSISACGGGGSDAATTTVPATTRATNPPTTAARTTTTTRAATTTTTEVITATYPLTGLPAVDPAVAGRPALAVKMDNHPDARPHAGLNQADIVYEEIVEGITRFFVIFHSTDASPIGPIRSARTTDVDLLNQLNRPLFAWSGGNRGVVNAIGNANAESRSASQAPGFYRDADRRARADLEHTLMHQGTEILFTTIVAGQGAPMPFFEYRGEDDAFAGAPASKIDMKLNSVPVSWTWNEPDARWIRQEYGDPHVDITGAPVSAENIVVQFCDYRTSPADPKSPEAVTVGSGDAWYFSDGKIMLGRWERPDASKPAVFLDGDGAPVELTPGRTWIELAEQGDTEVNFS